jgi:hypothetical protein
MLAGGMTIAAPSMMVPEAQAAGALYVSAENAMFDNTFGGAQIIEVIVIDGQDETDEVQGEPVVKVDENQLRMAQGVDGNWYGYFGDKTTVAAADTAANNLDFGTDADPLLVIGDWTEANNVFHSAAAGVVSNAPELSNFNKTNTATALYDPYGVGQIGVSNAQWPIIQLYDLTIENFEVVYEQAGADERVSLNFDSSDLDDYASLTLDRNSGSIDSEIHLVITDNQLNIDPTAEDIVIFYVGATDTDKNVSFTDGSSIASSDYLLYDNYFDDNGNLIIANATNGGTSILANDATLDDTTADNFMVFYEGGENSGIFYNTDDDDDSSLEVASNAARGYTATFDYNDSAQSYVVANDFGTIDMEEASVGDVWNSGEALTVTIIDQDLNKNTASNEDLLIVNTTNTHLIPTLKIGDPLVVEEDSTSLSDVTTYSKIGYFSNTTYLATSGPNIPYVIDLGYTGTQLDAMDTDDTYFNFDVSSLSNATNSITEVTLVDASDAGILVTVANPIDGKGIVQITTPNGHTGALKVEVKTSQLNGDAEDDTYILNLPIVADIFSFSGSANNAIYRILAEETGDNTATFVGTVEYTMLNQLNVDDTAMYLGLATIDQDVDIIVHEDLTDEDSPRVNYFDMGADGVSTQIADQIAAPTHSGVVSLDLDNYKIADTVVVTLDDQDMNTDSELIDVYTTSATDSKVGDGTASGLVLDITFDDQVWTSKALEGTCSGTISGDDGLIATGFTLVETGTETGIFTGSFQVPTNFCHSGSSTIVTVTGTDIEVNYQDFRNS